MPKYPVSLSEKRFVTHFVGYYREYFYFHPFSSYTTDELRKNSQFRKCYGIMTFEEFKRKFPYRTGDPKSRSTTGTINNYEEI